MIFSATRLICCVACLVALQDGDDKSAALQKKAEEVGKATLDGDYDKLADMTYPKVIEIMGGKQKMVTLTDNGMKMMKKQGFELKKFDIGKPSEFVSENGTTYSIVPTTLEITSPNGMITSESYLLALSSDEGKEWTFVDGSGLENKPMRERLFPKLPEKLKLPAKKPPKVSKEK